MKRRLLWRPTGMGHLGVTLADVDGATFQELVELDQLLEAGHAAEEKARAKAERDGKRKR
jgi:hypothetical protein